ncbi:peptidase A4 family-domain-containing protein [Boletus edulis]|nr:peptidase A4 family-domain-containing protein [Boletus edulis]
MPTSPSIFTLAMRLSCALVSSFLFISAVLAEYHPERQQPPFLNRVEKSINSTTLIPFNFKWAGAVWTRPSATTDYAAGSFTVPRAEGPIIGSGFYIAVSIGSYTCGRITLAAGITVKVVEGGASYEAWGRWYSDDVRIAPNSFPISVGHVIGAIVQQSSLTSGVIALINFTTGKVWTTFVSGNTVLCQQDADWVITTLPSLFDIPLANFHMVTFTHIEAHIDGAYKAPDHTETRIRGIEEDGRLVTSVSAYENFVVIVYIPVHWF